MRSTVMLAYFICCCDVERGAREKQLGRRRTPALRRGAKPADAGRYQGVSGARAAADVAQSPIGQAMAYTLSNWEALVRLRQDGDLEIDNNGAERSLRGVAVGRRNWDLLRQRQRRPHDGGVEQPHRHVQRHHTDPFAYLRDVFTRIGLIRKTGSRNYCRQLAGRRTASTA